MDRTLPTGRDGLPGGYHATLLGPLAQAELARRAGRLGGDGEVVVVGALCREPDLEAAACRLRAAVGDSGRLHLLEHVDRVGWGGRLHEALDPVWSRVPGGCHVGRDVLAALRRAGFFVTDLERFTMPTPTYVLRPWVQGTAVPFELPARS